MNAAAEVSTLHGMLGEMAQRHRDRNAFEYRPVPQETGDVITFGELDDEARAIAAHLVQLAMPCGRPVALVYPPGLEFIAAFFGCLYAGLIPAPSMLALTAGGVARVAAVVNGAGAVGVMTNSAYLPRLQRALADRGAAQSLAWIATDDVGAEVPFRGVAPTDPRAIAFLQYSSGSTGEPKGVAISHTNALHNLGLLRTAFDTHFADRCVSWLPHYHDMGLIAGILHSISAGISARLISPAAFLRDPLCWLEAISADGATMSGGPNFAYERCIATFDADRLRHLDLSQWKVAICGAEPIRAETVDRFIATFAPFGFDPGAFYPTYGLAEATLMVSGARRGGGARTFVFRETTGGIETVRRIVGCGPPVQDVRVVDPETLAPLAEGQAGEILVAGGSLFPGYWDRTGQAPAPATVRTPDGHAFFRTGDLGVVLDGELCIAGRTKDLIVLRGRKLHPNDIEALLEKDRPEWRFCAFAIFEDGEEGVAVVVDTGQGEAHPDDLRQWRNEIGDRMLSVFDVTPQSVAFVATGQLPRTTSGKLQRQLCRTLHLQGHLRALQEAPT